MRFGVYILWVFLLSFVCLEAKLQTRRNYFDDRRRSSSSDQRGWYQPTSVADAEDEVNRLRMEAINDYDDGVYIARWGKKRNRALDIQTKLGYTVPERYTWGW